MTTTLYEGTKRVHAKPMNRGDYNSYRGWEVPADENPSDEGYLVEYVDGGRGNDSRHAGYISWSPKDVFERSYKEVKTVPGLAPHQQRVMDEHIDTALADHMSGKPMPGWEVPKATHQVKVGITIHTTSDSSTDDWYSNTVAAGVGMLQGRSFKPGLIMGGTTDNQTHVMAEFEVPMLSTMLAPEPATTLQPHQQRVAAFTPGARCIGCEVHTKLADS